MKVLKNTIHYKHETDEGRQIIHEVTGDLQIELTADEMIEFVQSGDPSELVNEICGHELFCTKAKLTNGSFRCTAEHLMGGAVEYRTFFVFDLEILQWGMV